MGSLTNLSLFLFLSFFVLFLPYLCEADRHTPADGSAEAQSWPSNGQISFVGTQLRYRPNLPLVLKGLDIEIPASTRVGVVGRTGKYMHPPLPQNARHTLTLNLNLSTTNRS